MYYSQFGFKQKKKIKSSKFVHFCFRNISLELNLTLLTLLTNYNLLAADFFIFFGKLKGLK